MPDLVCKTDVEIKNRNGLHMRPAMFIVDAASRFSSDIKISNPQTVADAKSIMQVTMLAAGAGTKLTITAKGSDCQEAVNALKDLIEVRMFDEKDTEEAVGA